MQCTQYREEKKNGKGISDKKPKLNVRLIDPFESIYRNDVRVSTTSGKSSTAGIKEGLFQLEQGAITPGS